MSKTYTMYFEGLLEIEADSDEEAIDTLWGQASIKDIQYWRIAETEKPYSLKEIRIVKEA